jgi:DNA-binding FadR family transcriptional regulator
MRCYPDLKVTIIQDHVRVFEAIVARDETGAESIMRKHFAIGDEYRRRAATAEAMT